MYYKIGQFVAFVLKYLFVFLKLPEREKEKKSAEKRSSVTLPGILNET